MTGGDYLWSDPNNWSSHAVPQNGAPATFSGTYNSHCIVNTNTTQGTISLENGFTAPIEIENGDTLNIPGFDDLDIPADVFNVQFLGANAVQNFKPGQDVMGSFNWQAGGKTTVNGGAVNIGNKANLSQSTASPVIINSGSVNIGPANATSGTSTFKLTNGSADINVNANGILNFRMPTVATTTLVDNTGTAAQISNNGTVSLVNSPGGGTAKIAVPFENHATLNANQGGVWNFTAADNNGNDLYMDAGKITMSGGVSISCNHAYTQSGGTLEIADNKVESLLVFPGKPTNFNGGKIVFNPSTGWGILSLDIATFNGVEIDMRIAGNAGSPANDQIQCRGAGGNTCTIQGNSKLVVTAVNAVQPKLTWTLITPGAGNKIAGDFLAANITLPNGVKENLGALPNSWQCNS